MSDCETTRMQPIGSVQTEVPDDAIARTRREIVSRIVIEPAYEPALLGIEAYSHLFVLFWLHRQEPPQSLVHHPRGDPALPLTGILAGRGRNHPNAIGLAVVELLERRGCVLEVRRLDAFDGTPVLDIKPYDHYDSVADPRVPDWFRARAMTKPA